ncbi:hypothetical protein B0J14DRAFT_569679 [Halenospora varia]|nr:hypothetical protein B0J14DRAFT_569679 [Halenospora varia]
MARGPTRVKAMTPLEYPEVWHHIQTMFDQRTIGTDFPPRGNPNVVRVASWRGVLLHVRDRMSRTLPEQYPDVEGPIKRFCFTTGSGTLSGSLPWRERRKLSISLVGGFMASRKMEWENQFHDIPTGAHGILVAKALDLLPVFIRGDDDFKRQTVSYIDSSEYPRSAEPTEEFSSLATVSKEGNEGSRLKINSSLGLLREWSVEIESELKTNIAKSMVVLKNLVKAHHLLTLKSLKPWAHGLDVEYGWVDSGQRMPLTDPNHVLYAGQALYITL